ncbi:hypothetical protein M4951_24770 [Blastopirellula sp. J2-11]|uniref:hypothetical protein n=1 Tax=Blastopirellula sp. J2-11 TaxID=2943192 RepID=UPI0021CA2A88|nr:hypothetical protein [Blastopirellula sp. J2-11]UUO06544.1 hypothetical protein M4951_24770 [Blastopirellula sp. J2-11]
MQRPRTLRRFPLLRPAIMLKGMTPLRLLRLLFLAATLAVDAALLAAAEKWGARSIPGVLLLGGLLAQCGAAAIYLGLAPRRRLAFRLLVGSAAAVTAALLMARLTPLTWQVWLATLSALVSLIAGPILASRVLTMSKRQFSLAEILGLTTLIALFCAALRSLPIQMEYAGLLLGCLTAMAALTWLAAWLIATERNGPLSQAALIVAAFGLGQLTGAIDASPAAGFFASTIFTAMAVYYLIWMLVEKHGSQPAEVPSNDTADDAKPMLLPLANHSAATTR